MDAKQVSQICLNGAERYLEYIGSKPNGGVEEISISRIEPVVGKQDSYKLIVTKKLFELDAILIQLQTRGDEWRFFDEKQIKVKLYDKEKNVLLVKVAPEVVELFTKYQAKHWKVIYDLKFLIQRVIDWYELNGSTLTFVDKRPVSKLDFDQSVIFEDSKPSPEQLDALRLIFASPVSYIWGAPGTGKTRFVLSYALLTYIKNNKKVLILAPTNIALEQIFNGVIEVTDKAGIKKKQLLRLGYPTKTFAAKHGETCEVVGLEKQIAELEKQIAIISAVLGIDTETEAKLKNLLAGLNEYHKSNDQQKKIIARLNQIKEDAASKQQQIGDCEKRLSIIELGKKEVIRKKHALTTKLLKMFSNKIDYDQILNNLIAEQENLSLTIVQTKADIEKLTPEAQQLQAATYEINNVIQGSKENLLGLADSVGIKAKDITEKNLQEKIAREAEEKAEYISMAQEYQSVPEMELRRKLDEYSTELEKLKAYSIEERIANASVIGATLDTFLFRFKENPLDVAHVFIDEAGYASLIKSLTAYKLKVPVTLLGDHKQLQPVSEISKADIKKDENYNDVFVWDQSSIYVEDLWTAKDAEQALSRYLLSASPEFNQLNKSSLTLTYRFGNNLADTLSNYVYKEDGFSSGLDRDTEIVIYDAVNPQQARYWGREKRANQAEAECIVRIVHEKIGIEGTFAILAPYRTQVSILQKLLSDLIIPDQVLTVHKSQGQEWDTVIYSPCDIGNGQKPWFTDSKSKISNGLNNVNTAVSRAKKKIIIVCSAEQWKQRDDQLIAGLINSGTTFHEFDSRNITIPEKPPKQLKQKTYKRSGNTDTPNKTSNCKYIESTSANNKAREWESKLLYWSSARKPGYRWSRKKQAWWKSKED